MLAQSSATEYHLVGIMIRFLTQNHSVSPKFCTRPVDRRHGRGLVEVIVVAGIVAFAFMILLVALPKGRESARMVTCQKNLMQIGVGLQMYHQAQLHYPTVPRLDGTIGDSPIQALFQAFVVPDLLEMRDPSKPPKSSQAPPRGTRVPGLTCPSDSNAVGGVDSPFLSYRANTGDSPLGHGGPFEPGRATTSGEVERADGSSFTAAYAERLVGHHKDGSAVPANYASLVGLVDGANCPDCPLDRWRGDSGADWAESSWRSSLYSHVLGPDAPRSCIAVDGRSALMGASSDHSNRVNVLMMDGSLKGITPGINPKVWQALGTVGYPAEPVSK